MLWRTLALVTGCLAVASCSWLQPQPDSSLLRWDGLYYTAEPDEEVYYYLRFYPDGGVLAVSAFDDPSEVLTWLSREHNGPAIGRGQFHLDPEQRLTFSTTSPYGQVDYEAVILAEALLVKLYSHKTGYRGTSRYRFMPQP